VPLHLLLLHHSLVTGEAAGAGPAAAAVEVEPGAGAAAAAVEVGAAAGAPSAALRAELRALLLSRLLPHLRALGAARAPLLARLLSFALARALGSAAAAAAPPPPPSRAAAAASFCSVLRCALHRAAPAAERAARGEALLAAAGWPAQLAAFGSAAPRQLLAATARLVYAEEGAGDTDSADSADGEGGAGGVGGVPGAPAAAAAAAASAPLAALAARAVREVQAMRPARAGAARAALLRAGGSEAEAAAARAQEEAQTVASLTLLAALLPAAAEVQPLGL